MGRGLPVIRRVVMRGKWLMLLLHLRHPECRRERLLLSDIVMMVGVVMLEVRLRMRRREWRRDRTATGMISIVRMCRGLIMEMWRIRRIGSASDWD